MKGEGHQSRILLQRSIPIHLLRDPHLEALQ